MLSSGNVGVVNKQHSPHKVSGLAAEPAAKISNVLAFAGAQRAGAVHPEHM